MLIIAAIAPAILLLLILYTIDHHNREPLRLLLRLYLLGMIATLPILFLELTLQRLNIFAYFDTDLTNAYEAFIVAGFSEELFKWLIVMVFAYRHIAYDEHLDGIIYCVFIGLGFATVENILYVTAGDYTLALTRGLLSVPMHMLFAVTMGYYLSLCKFETNLAKKGYNLLVSLALPVLLHGIYDYLLLSRYRLLLLLFIPFVLWMWISNIRHLYRYYKDSAAGNVVTPSPSMGDED